LGISPDSPKSHRKFKERYQLTFTLLADVDHAVAEQYGVWQEKSMYGKKYWGVARTTFIIGADGRIAKVFEKVKPENHGEEVADAIAALNVRDGG
jgi:peroxiredoxin Q/BCP